MTVLAAERVAARTARGDLSWIDQAACAGMDVELFFPDTGKQSARITRAARVTCYGCPVRAACYAHIMMAERGLGEAARYGIYAGLTGAERYALDPDRGRRNAAGGVT